MDQAFARRQRLDPLRALLLDDVMADIDNQVWLSIRAPCDSPLPILAI
ncbi:MAG: hypothetical protein V4472_12840 [Pseudomonadota bacterium]